MDIFFLSFCPYCFQLQRSLYVYPYPFLDIVTTTRERVVEAAAAFETTTSDTSLLTRPAGNHQQTVIPASNPGEEEEQAYLRRTRPAYPAEGGKDTSAAVQIPTELSYFFSHPRLPSRPAIQTGCPPRPSAPAPPPPKS